MAVLSITLKRKDITRNHVRRLVAIQLTGAFGNPDPVDLTTMLNPKKIPHGKFGGVGASTLPLPSTDDCAAFNAPDGYSMQLQQNAVAPTFKNFQLYLYTTAATAVTGNVPAGLLGVDLVFEILTPLKYD